MKVCHYEPKPEVLTATTPSGAKISRSFCKFTLANISITMSTPSPDVAVCK